MRHPVSRSEDIACGVSSGRMVVYVVLVGGLLGLCAYVARDPVRDLLGRTASAWLSRQLNGTVEIGALRGSLLSSLVLRDVVLRDRPGHRGGAPGRSTAGV